MAIYIGENTKVIVQGITGNQGSFHTRQMLAYGTKIVAGVSPGKGGQTVEGVPVYDTVAAAMEEHGADASVLFIPAPFAKDAAFEAIDAGIKVVVIITEHIPVHDEMEIIAFARRRGVTVVGPNTFGIISSGKCKIGIMPNQFFVPGEVGVVSRSGTLSYEIVANLKAAGMGTSTVVGLGGDRVVGLNFKDVLEKFEEDEETKAVVMVGEIGGSAEEEAAAFIKEHISKPVVAYLAGKSAPPGKRMGHAGAIIERGKGTFEGKVKALTEAGVRVAELPFEVPQLLREVLEFRAQ
ncbi:succinate--CoA ligase subunit alpha [Calderihabitans maritimus]|uniref:Succinate--CoA ligase [ADP-forming] subunit alpha n=1 Tax=Calderihabitans maritimus TaxID=1246530 RepID=A0A1Z5HY37_9FIRM|nr:succinate--CoA ligase subunit alpha [Calderihabitans maritimus]GAW94261.1 succinyl-CoA synthetase subunit alpha [Calderihabitans maritimus]